MAASSHYGEKVANTKTLKVGLGNMTLTEHGWVSTAMCTHIVVYPRPMSTKRGYTKTQQAQLTLIILVSNT